MTESDPEVIVKIEDLRAIKYCMPACREWFKAYGFSWSDFLANGISSTKLESTRDGLVAPAIEHARKRTANG